MESIFLFLQLSQKYLHSNVYTQKWYTLFFLKFRIQSGYMTEPGRYVPSLPANQEQFLQYVRLGGCLHVTDICKESGQLTYRIPHILDLSGCLLQISLSLYLFGRKFHGGYYNSPICSSTNHSSHQWLNMFLNPMDASLSSFCRTLE